MRHAGHVIEGKQLQALNLTSALPLLVIVKKIAVDLAQMPRGNPVCRKGSSEYRCYGA
jgi:hypothetical protein